MFTYSYHRLTVYWTLIMKIRVVFGVPLTGGVYFTVTIIICLIFSLTHENKLKWKKIEYSSENRTPELQDMYRNWLLFYFFYPSQIILASTSLLSAL